MLGKCDSVGNRVCRILEKLAAHGLHEFALTGSLALEAHFASPGSASNIRSLNDVDIVVASFGCIPPALADSFLFRHIHPSAPEGKTLIQLVDPGEALHIDIFRAYGATLARSKSMTFGTRRIAVVSLEDLAARAASLVMDLAHGSAVPLKHARAFQRLEAAIDRDPVEVAWRDHRRQTDPETFREASLRLQDLIPSSPELLVVPDYSHDVDSECSRCQDIGRFRRAPARTILSILTVVQNRFLKSEIEECPPIIDVGEQFLAGSLQTLPQEGNLIVQVASLFNQLLQHFPRTEFAALVKKHAAEREAKGFACWTQFVSMLFCQLGRADSLREICNGLSCCLGRLVHVGIARAPCRSTLSYANEHRPAALFEDLFFTALARFREQQGLGTRKHKFRFKNKLLSLDSTTISLCLTMFPWAKFRPAKGGVKAHVLLDHDDYLPAYVLLTEAKRSDVKLADSFRLNPGSIVAIDRGYIDYALFGRWSMAGVFFVTRLKDNAAFEVVEECVIPQNRNIRADQFIRLTGAQAQADYPDLLRRIVAWDPQNEREIILLTNLVEFGATTIAAIYKERWQIELFFKALKQNLTVKTFVGTSENALRIQIWTALIALLLLKWLHHLSKANWSLSNLASMLRLNLFTYCELAQWIDNPMGTPPLIPAAEQLTLALV